MITAPSSQDASTWVRKNPDARRAVGTYRSPSDHHHGGLAGSYVAHVGLCLLNRWVYGAGSATEPLAARSGDAVRVRHQSYLRFIIAAVVIFFIGVAIGGQP